jgi:hypothetical protein
LQIKRIIHAKWLVLQTVYYARSETGLQLTLRVKKQKLSSEEELCLDQVLWSMLEFGGSVKRKVSAICLLRDLTQPYAQLD